MFLVPLLICTIHTLREKNILVVAVTYYLDLRLIAALIRTFLAVFS